MANQGIMHLAFEQGGKPFCRTRRSIMSTTVELSSEWPRVCVKCKTIHDLRIAKLNAKSN
jgi:hypothetical protein